MSLPTRLLVIVLAVAMLGILIPIQKAFADTQSTGVDYLGRTVQINSFDWTEVSSYDQWTFTGGAGMSRTYDDVATEGTHSMRLDYDEGTAGFYSGLTYSFTKFPGVPLSRMDSLQF